MRFLLFTLFVLITSCAPVRFSTQAEREKAADEMSARLGIAPAPVRGLGLVGITESAQPLGTNTPLGIPPRPQTVVLISFDGFRWDYRHRGLTPTLDSIAAQGVSALSLRPVFPSLTFPNHYAIITGQYPQHHGILSNGFVNPATGAWFRVNKDSLKRQSEWYQGEALWETARKHGVRTASHSYPASDINDISRQPDYVVPFSHALPLNDRIDTILAWLRLPEEQRPRFVCAYIEIVDAAGHETGVHSERTNSAIRKADSLVQRLWSGLQGISGDINLIICSDHGMTDVSPAKTLNMKSLLADVQHRSFGNGEIMQFESVERTEAGNTYLFEMLRARQHHFQVYRKEHLPGWYGSLRHGFVLPLVAIAEPAWLLDDGLYAGLFTRFPNLGKHGWDADWTDMHGIFLGVGPAFKEGYSCGTLRNVDIAPLISTILGFAPHERTDGDVRKIGFLLKSEGSAK